MKNVERKVLVIEAYHDHRKEAEEEVLFDVAFLCVDSLMLKIISFARKGSEKKGKDQKGPKKWLQNNMKRRNAGQSYNFSSGKAVSKKSLPL